MLEVISNALRPYNELIGIAGLVVGAALSLYFYLISKREKKLRFGIFSQTILSGASTALKGLEVSFKGAPQDRVTVSRVLIWNDGKLPIVQADIAKSDPLRIVAKNGADILALRVFSTTSSACDVHVTLDGFADDHTEFLVNFAFLNYRDGFAVEMVHNGAVDHPLSLMGTIIGAEAPEHFNLDFRGVAEGGMHERVYTGCMFLLILILFYGAFSIGKHYNNTFIPYILAMVITLPIMLFGASISTKILPSVPKTLRAAVSSGINPLYPERRSY